MSSTQLFEDPAQVMDRILKHAEYHINLAKQALENREWDTLDFTLRVAWQDISTLLGYLNKLREMGYIKSIGVGEKSG